MPEFSMSAHHINSVVWSSLLQFTYILLKSLHNMATTGPLEPLFQLAVDIRPELEASQIFDRADSLPTPFSDQDLNPLLAREKWQIDDSTWKLIWPFVNLASALLGSEASTIFLYSLINSSPRRNFELSKKLGTNIDYISKIDPYSARWPIGEVRQEY